MNDDFYAVLIRQPISIGLMQPGSIWIADGELGITCDEARSFVEGKVTGERAQEIRSLINTASNSLNSKCCAGVQFWMTNRRAMA